MNRTYKITCALTVLTLALAGCAGKTNKVPEVKPNPLPKISQTKTLVPVFSTSVSSTEKADPLRLRLDADNGVVFAIDPRVKSLLLMASSACGRKKSAKIL